MMREDLLREIAQEHLVPFFSGATLEKDAKGSSARDKLVAYLDPQSIAFKVDKADPYRLVLSRSQPFQAEKKVGAETAADAQVDVVSELLVVRAFVDALHRIADIVDTEFKNDILSTFAQRVVAKAMCAQPRTTSVNVAQHEATLLSGINQLAAWSERTYEGAPISSAIGFRHKSQPEDTPSMADLSDAEFVKVLGNGYDTLLEFDMFGKFISHVVLPVVAENVKYCPYRQRPVAEWTAKDTTSRRVALTLNRNGEILVFRDAQLQFARRAGRWHFLTHKPVLDQMGAPHSTEIRRAIYETCIDASFGRRGACFGIVSSNMTSKLNQMLDVNDHLSSPSNTIKNHTLQLIVNGRLFHDLDRRIRQELASIDGATVISNEGNILAIGAIVRIPGVALEEVGWPRRKL